MDLPGKRIQRWREYLRKTRDEFAEITGIPYSTLSTLENNADPAKKPSWDIIAKLRKGCPQLNIDWLFDEGDTEPMLKEGRLLAQVPATQSNELATPTDLAKFPERVKQVVETPTATVLADYEPGNATPRQADFVGRLISQLEAENSRKDSLIEWLQEQNAQLLKKPSASLDAAGVILPDATPISLRPTACLPTAQVPAAAPAECVVRALWGEKPVDVAKVA